MWVEDWAEVVVVAGTRVYVPICRVLCAEGSVQQNYFCMVTTAATPWSLQNSTREVSFKKNPVVPGTASQGLLDPRHQV